MEFPFSVAINVKTTGRTFYVDPSGNDSNSGSAASPWATPQRFGKTAQPGDTLIIRAGTYQGFIFGWDNKGSGSTVQVINGTSGNPITIKADPNAAPGTVVIDGRNAKTAVAIDFEPGCDYLYLQNLWVRDAGHTTTKAGIKCVGKNCIIQGNNVSGTGGVAGINTSHADYTQVLNNTITNQQGSGTNGHGIYLANASVGIICRGNIVYGNPSGGIHVNGDGSGGGTGIFANAVIEQNLIYNNTGNGINCDGIQNSTIQNNLVYGATAYGIVLYKSDALGASTGNTIINNTVSSATAAFRALNSAINNTLRNNIFLAADNNTYRIDFGNSLTGLVSDYNSVSNNFQNDSGGGTITFAQWKSTYSQDSHSFTATAASLFVNPGTDYHLSATSPAIDTGTSTGAPSTDFDGNVRPYGMGYDIGCYERSSPYAAKNQHYLVGPSGPLFLVGDAAWSLIAATTLAEAKTYIDDRVAKGFNAILVNLIEHYYSPNAPRNMAGDYPFGAGSTHVAFIDTPNEAYFAFADSVINYATGKGLYVMLDPSYLGYQGGSQGWYASMQSAVASNPQAMTQWGQYVGNRYKNKNIIWVEGADFNPPSDGLGFVNQIATAIATYSAGMHTGHQNQESSARDIWNSYAWLALNSTYTYDTVKPSYVRSLVDYNRNPVSAAFLIEDRYEGEGPNALQCRSSKYWNVLSGSSGCLMGNNPIWGFDYFGGWLTGLNTRLAQDMTKLGSLFSGRQWYNLVPDQTHVVVTAGYGSGSSLVTTARSADGHLIMSYCPGNSTITVDMTKNSGASVTARWYDPVSGSFSTISGSPFVNTGTHQFATPGNNSGGSPDWVLVLES